MKEYMIKIFVLTVGFLLLVGNAAGATEEAKLIALDGAESDVFGYSVSVDGDTAVIGAPSDNDKGYKSGSVYVFTRSFGTWTQQAKLNASDGAPYNNFGASVSVDGDTAVISSRAGRYSNSGPVYVFTRSGTTWTQQAKLNTTDVEASDCFGYSISVYGDTVVIGANQDDGKGSAYVFTRSGTTWTQQAKLNATDGETSDDFGTRVSVDGDTVLIGASGDDDWDDGRGYNSGSAYVFTRSGATWTQQAKLNATDGAEYDIFGYSVSVDGDTAVIGAQYNDGAKGSAYVFTRSGASWTQQAKLNASDGAVGDFFGNMVSVDGDTAVICAFRDDDGKGSAYVFTRSGTTWIQQAKLNASDDAVGAFGFRVSLDGDTAVIGVPYDDDNGYNSGAAYVYSLGIISVNDAPIISADGSTVTVDEGQIAVNNGIVSDADGDDITLSASVGTVVNNNDDTWSWSFITSDGPDETQTVTITADDGNGGVTETTFELIVNNVAPIIIEVSNDGPIIEGGNSTVNIIANDPGIDVLSYAIDWNNNGSFEILTYPVDIHKFENAGEFTVNVTVTDDDGAVTTGQTVVIVLTTQEAIEIQINEVEKLIDEEILNEGQDNGLNCKLENIIAKIDKDNVKPAINQLEAFINQINGFISEGILSPEEGQPLIDAANEIIDVLDQ